MKRSRQAEKSRRLNSAVKSQVRKAANRVVEALESGKKEAALEALSSAIPRLDKAAAKGVFSKKTISRKISRLTKKVNALLK